MESRRIDVRLKFRNLVGNPRGSFHLRRRVGVFWECEAMAAGSVDRSIDAKYVLLRVSSPESAYGSPYQSIAHEPDPDLNITAVTFNNDMSMVFT